jgi:hypothetical protein
MSFETPSGYQLPCESLFPKKRDTRRRASGLHRQEVDDIGPVLPVLVAVAHQAGRDCVAVRLVTDQHISEVLAGRRIARQEQIA